jgi:hypothetical protein
MDKILVADKQLHKELLCDILRHEATIWHSWTKVATAVISGGGNLSNWHHQHTGYSGIWCKKQWLACAHTQWLSQITNVNMWLDQKPDCIPVASIINPNPQAMMPPALNEQSLPSPANPRELHLIILIHYRPWICIIIKQKDNCKTCVCYSNCTQRNRWT